MTLVQSILTQNTKGDNTNVNATILDFNKNNDKDNKMLMEKLLQLLQTRSSLEEKLVSLIQTNFFNPQVQNETKNISKIGERAKRLQYNQTAQFRIGVLAVNADGSRILAENKSSKIIELPNYNEVTENQETAKEKTLKFFDTLVNKKKESKKENVDDNEVYQKLFKRDSVPSMTGRTILNAN